MDATVYVLSIGLNVGRTEPIAQLDEAIQQVRARFGPIHAIGMCAGEWQGVSERTVHIAVLVPSPIAIALNVPGLCRGLRQECIAVWRKGAGVWDLWASDGPRPDGAAVSDFPVAIPAEVL